MRRTAFLLLVFLAPLLICSCGKKQPPGEKAAVAKTAETKTPARPSSPALPKAAGADYQEGSLKIRISAADNRKESAKESPVFDHSNVVILDRAKNTQKTADAGGKKKSLKKSQIHRLKLWTAHAPGSLAARLAPKNADKIIQWHPKLVLAGTSGVRLPDAAVSPDKSLLAFVETLGDEQGICGSRIIAFDTHTWTIPVLYVLPEDRIRKVAFIGDTGKIAALSTVKTEEGETRNRLLVFDLQTGMTTASCNLAYSPSRMVTDAVSGLVYITEARSPLVRIYNPENLEKPLKTIQCAGVDPAIAFTDQGRTLVLAAAGLLEFRKTSDFRPLSSQALPDNLTPQEILIPDSSLYLIVPPKLAMGEGICILNGSVRRFGVNCGGILADSFEPDTFFALMSRKGEIVQFALPSLEKKTSIIPEDISPKKPGDPVRIFSIPHAKCLAVLDSSGNFYLLYRDVNGRKWQKELLFSPAKE